MVLWLTLFVVVPGAILLVYSFCERDEVGGVIYTFTLHNYQRVFDGVYLWIFARSIGYAAATTALCVIIGYPVAYYTSRGWRRACCRLLLLVMVPFWTSFLIRTYSLDHYPEAGRIAQQLMEATRLDIGLSQPALHPRGRDHRPGLRLPAFHDPADLRQRRETRQFPDRSGIRPWSRTAPRVLVSDCAADDARHCRGHPAGLRSAIGMFAITDLMGGAKVPIGNLIQNQFLQARDWPFGAALGVVFMLMFALTYVILQRRGSIKPARET